jgi:flagellar biosynthetic protein FliQ
MELPFALDLSRNALIVALIISAPILGIGVLVGLAISLIQAVTQIQDQTVSIVPKIVAMIGVAILFVPWLTQRIVEYSQQLFAGP